MRTAKIEISLRTHIVLVFRLMKRWTLYYPFSAHPRLWSDCANAQTDLSPRWAHIPTCSFSWTPYHPSLCEYFESLSMCNSGGTNYMLILLGKQSGLSIIYAYWVERITETEMLLNIVKNKISYSNENLNLCITRLSFYQRPASSLANTFKCTLYKGIPCLSLIFWIVTTCMLKQDSN